LKKEANSSIAEFGDKQKVNDISQTAWVSAQRGNQEFDSLKAIVRAEVKKEPNSSYLHRHLH